MTGNGTGRLTAETLTLAYGGFEVARDLSLSLPDGQITTIIGPNACGKSTALRALGRLLRPKAGAVYLDGHAIHRLPAKEVARRLGLLSQQATAPEGITVEDLARRGRYPHQRFLQPPTRTDHEAVERALALAGVEELRYRPMDQLSGGQRQRAWMAMALAQETPILLLDEPTTYLDIAHQEEILQLVRRLNREEGRTIVMVLHDVNEAAAASDRILAMRDGAIVSDGPPEAVVQPELLREIFGVECDVIAHPAETHAISIPRSSFSPRSPGGPLPDSQLETRSLGLAYGSRRVVSGLDLTIPAGRITAIVGPNACGKSTVLRSLSRLIAPAEGTVMFDGRPLGRFKPRELALRVGMLPQSPLPPPEVLVEDLVASGRYPHQRWFRQWSREDEAAVSRALTSTGTAEFRHRPAEQLSGGQRQRVFLAMALVREAPVMLFDEPTTFLDIAHQVEVLDLIARANHEREATVVMVLHDLNLAARYADWLVAMKDGTVVAAGPPGEIVSAHLVRSVFGVEATVTLDPRTQRPLILSNVALAAGTEGPGAPLPGPSPVRPGDAGHVLEGTVQHGH